MEKKKYTKEEYEKLYKKGRGFLMDYLAEITEGKFVEEEYMLFHILQVHLFHFENLL